MSVRGAVAAVVVGLVLIVAGCKGDAEVPTPCPTTEGCLVPTTGTEELAPEGLTPDDPAYSVMACLDTGNKGPCRAIAAGTDDECHWWFVDVGHTLYDGSARDLGIWALGPGEVCS